MRVFVETYGCTMNQGEGRLLARRLSAEGHRIVSEEDQADACVLVTCTVIEATERKMRKRMQQLSQNHRRLIVAGCMASAQSATVLGAVPRATLVPPSRVEEVGRLLPGAVDREYECREPETSV
nr:MiaB/RimO family radical SAM methylthiotransferase [Gemmatimonadales bacterium]